MKSPGIMVPVTNPDKRLINKIVKFVDEFSYPIADISEPNTKMEMIAEQLNFLKKVEYIHGVDYNFCYLCTSKVYRTIFCLEILEHLQNPLFCMANIEVMLNQNGIIYLSMPARPKLFWPDFHYNEISPKRFKKWILEPLYLKVVKQAFIRNPLKIKFRNLIGIRPIIRIILFMLNGSYIYKIVKK